MFWIIFALKKDLICIVFLGRALTQMKARLKGAQKGHSLLKKKADALTLRFRQILTKIIEVLIVLSATDELEFMMLFV